MVVKNFNNLSLLIRRRDLLGIGLTLHTRKRARARKTASSTICSDRGSGRGVSTPSPTSKEAASCPGRTEGEGWPSGSSRGR